MSFSLIQTSEADVAILALLTHSLMSGVLSNFVTRSLPLISAVIDSISVPNKVTSIYITIFEFNSGSSCVFASFEFQL